MQINTNINYINTFSELPKDIKVFNKLLYNDERGFMSIQFEMKMNISIEAISLKRSFSNKNVARGLHIQNAPYEMAKIITVEEGDVISLLYNTKNESLYIFDFSSKHQISLLVPSYYANGYISKTDTVYSYICLGEYNEGSEISYYPFHLLNHENLIISKKDNNGLRLN